MGTTLTALAAVVAPLALGAALGLLLLRLLGRPLGGFVASIAGLVIPVALAGGLVFRFPLVGFWDALVEGFLVGAGIVWTAHRAFTGWTPVVLTVASLGLSLAALEVACRLFLPAPPSFPTTHGPHLLLADAMRADLESHSWNLRSKEIVCSVVYDEGYPGVLDVSEEKDVIVPRSFTPRADAARRVLHIGDSMTFGFGVARDETFSADLERLEPHTQHINGGIPGIAPDAYLAVLRRWAALQPVDLVVMYVFEENDLVALDDLYPCCDWQSLFTYGPDGPAWRCTTPPRIDFRKAGATWLQYNSPPPFLVRALIGHSAAAAHVGAAIVARMPGQPLAVYQSPDTQLEHLRAILHAAHSELRARGMTFVVVMLPSRVRVEGAATAPGPAAQIVQTARRLEIPTLDASSALRDAKAGGRNPYFETPGDPHFGPEGHRVIARWLHEQLAAVAPPP